MKYIETVEETTDEKLEVKLMGSTSTITLFSYCLYIASLNLAYKKYFLLYTVSSPTLSGVGCWVGCDVVATDIAVGPDLSSPGAQFRKSQTRMVSSCEDDTI